MRGLANFHVLATLQFRDRESVGIGAGIGLDLNLLRLRRLNVAVALSGFLISAERGESIAPLRVYLPLLLKAGYKFGIFEAHLRLGTAVSTVVNCGGCDRMAFLAGVGGMVENGRGGFSFAFDALGEDSFPPLGAQFPPAFMLSSGYHF